MKKVFEVLAVTVACLFASVMKGQNLHVSANLLDYLNLGTINAEIGLSPAPKWTIYIRGRYNPFSFRLSKHSKQVQNRTAGLAVGGRYWFWYSNSGWFLDSNLAFNRYNTAGVLDKYAYEGDAYGIGIGAGYALMLNRKWNLNFGAGLQGGHTVYMKYECSRCGKVIGRYGKFYLVPANMMVQLLRIL